MTDSDDIVLSEAELQRVTGYKQPAAQLTELHRQGFSRARRDRLGRVTLERSHYDAVTRAQLGEMPARRPMLKSQRQKATA